MTEYRVPFFVGFGSPLLDLAAGQIGPRNFAYVVGGTIADFGSFTQLTGGFIGAFAEQATGISGLALNVSKGLEPFARGAGFVGIGVGAAYDGVSTFNQVYEQSGSFLTALDFGNSAFQRSTTIGASAFAAGVATTETLTPFLTPLGPFGVPIGLVVGIGAGGATYFGLSTALPEREYQQFAPFLYVSKLTVIDNGNGTSSVATGTYDSQGNLNPTTIERLPTFLFNNYPLVEATPIGDSSLPADPAAASLPTFARDPGFVDPSYAPTQPSFQLNVDESAKSDGFSLQAVDANGNPVGAPVTGSGASSGRDAQPLTEGRSVFQPADAIAAADRPAPSGFLDDVGAALDSAGQTLSDLAAAVGDAASAVGDSFSSTFDGFSGGGTGSNAAASAFDASAFDASAGLVGSAFDGFAGGVGSAFDGFAGGVGDFFGNFFGGVGDFFGGFGSFFGPVVLDLAGGGIKITQLSSSNTFFDMAGDGYQHRTAWAGAGDAVLAFDANNDGQITQRNEIVFTDWDPTAKSDMQALRDVFDTDHDGKLDAGDAKFAQFKLLVTGADGTQSPSLSLPRVPRERDQRSAFRALPLPRAQRSGGGLGRGSKQSARPMRTALRRKAA